METVETIQNRLIDLSNQLENIEIETSQRLKLLAEDLKNGLVGEHAYTNLRALCDSAHVQDAAVLYYERRPAFINWLEMLRNVMILLPITATWIAISNASFSYNKLLETRPDYIDMSFIQLWERRFETTGGGFVPTFSEVAFFDFIVLFLVILVTLFVHFYQDVRSAKATKESFRLRKSIDQVLWEVDQFFSAERYRQSPSSMGDFVEDSIRHFRDDSKEVLDLIAFELKSLEKLNEQRQREVNSLKDFGKSLDNSAANLENAVIKVSGVYQRLHSSIEGFTERFDGGIDQQSRLVQAIEETTDQSTESADMLRRIAVSIESTMKELSLSSNHSTTDSQVINQTLNDMGKMISLIVESERTLRETLPQLKTEMATVTRGIENASNMFVKGAELNNKALESLQKVSSDFAKTGNMPQQMVETLVKISTGQEAASRRYDESIRGIERIVKQMENAGNTVMQTGQHLHDEIRALHPQLREAGGKSGASCWLMGAILAVLLVNGLGIFYIVLQQIVK